jgi:hypothetical protein
MEIDVEKNDGAEVSEEVAVEDNAEIQPDENAEKKNEIGDAVVAEAADSSEDSVNEEDDEKPDEEINFEELNHVYEAEMISQMKASEEIAINHKSSAGFGLNILMLNFNCNFINTLQMIEMGIIEGNNVFNVKIEYSNGLNTTHKMKIKGSDFAYNKNSQPIRTIRMLKGE